jgi:hypothetical protein
MTLTQTVVKEPTVRPRSTPWSVGARAQGRNRKRQRHHQTNDDQVADDRAEHEDHATVAPAGDLGLDRVEDDDRGDRDDHRVDGAAPWLVGEGGPGRCPQDEHGDPDREKGVEADLYPHAILKGLNDGILAVDPAFFS